MSEYNAADRKDIAAATKAAKLADTQRREVLLGIMSVAPGRRWILELIESCHVFAASAPVDALAMAFSEGERNIGLKLFADVVRTCPDQYVQMMKESNERAAADESRRSRKDTGGGDQGSEADSTGDDSEPGEFR